MTSIKVLGPDTSVESVVKYLNEDACVIVRELMGEDALGSLTREFEAPHPNLRSTGTPFAGFKTNRMHGILKTLPTTQRLALHPLILGVADQVLLPHAARYQLNYDGVMQLLPGESPQALHRDAFIYPIRQPTIPFQLATMWACTEFTELNGSTCIVPGSHRWEEGREPTEDEILSSVMPAGSVVIYTGGVYHGGGANRSDGIRTGVAIHYSLAWLRQELNMYLTYPPEVAREFPQPLQRLIGYDFAGPYLGFVENGSPHVHLEDAAAPAVRPRSTPELDAANERVARIPLGA